MAASSSNSLGSHHQLERSISLSDLDAALKVREIVQKDVVLPEDATKHRHFKSSTKSSLVLPLCDVDSVEQRRLVFGSLVDEHFMKELEATRRLNWCNSVRPMVALMTLGDGNCLMHAASLAMWAVNDRYQILRKTVYEALLEDAQGIYHRRWRCEQERLKHLLHGGYEMTAEQWDQEWQQVIRLVSQTEFPTGRNGSQFGSLEEIHIFVLANVLRRTIIVLSDETLRGPCGDSFFPINFGGIYLPLHWDPVDCVRSPLVICYAQGHFTAVVSTDDGNLDLGSRPTFESDRMQAVPLVKQNGMVLPVHFLLDDQTALADGLLRQYLDCAKVPFPGNQGVADQNRSSVLVARLHFTPQPSCMKDLVSGYFNKAREVSQFLLSQMQFQPSLAPAALHSPVNCETQGCTFSGSVETANRCSRCFNEYLKNLELASGSSRRIPAQTLVEQNQLPALPREPLSPRVPPPASLPLHHPPTAKCRTTSCKYGPIPGKGGLCERCYEAERGAEEMAAGMNRMALATSMPCANQVNGCQFFGLQEHHDLCSKCYRTFCLQMENTLGVPSPTGFPPTSPVPSAPPNLCQTPDCPALGVPALYNMCVPCYTGCIRAFISSEGRSVGRLERSILPPPPLPTGHTKPLPTGAGKKGILCASPGCFNERVLNLNDLCKECYDRKSGPVHPIRKTTSPISFPVSYPPPSSISAPTTAAVAPKYQLTSALTSAIGQSVCCAGKEPGNLCPKCQSQVAVSAMQNPPVVRPSGWQTPQSLPTSGMAPTPLLQGTQVRPSSAPATSPAVASSIQYPTFNPRALESKPCMTQNCSFFGIPERNFMCSNCFERQRAYARASHQHSMSQVHRPPTSNDQCAMERCTKPAVQDGLCDLCYSAAYQQEAQWVAQQSRQHGGTSFATSGQVEQRHPSPAGPSRPLQKKQTAVASSVMPCASKGCLNFGTPDKGGLCENCFRKRLGAHLPANAIPVPVTSSGRSVPVTSSGIQSIASTALQPQFGGHTTLGAQIPANARSVSVTSSGIQSIASTLAQPQFGGHATVPCTTQAPVQASQSPMTRLGNVTSSLSTVEEQRCKGGNCSHYGTPETNGYCSRCFLESTIPFSYPHSVPDLPREVPSSPEMLATAPRSTLT